MDIAGIENVCIPPWQIVQNTDDSSCVTAFGGLEIALWDLRGKVWQQPLYKLLGGAVRKEIPFTEYFAFRGEKDGKGGEKDPEGRCRLLCPDEGGTRRHFFRRQANPGRSAAGNRNRPGTLRQALGPDAMIRLDSNMQWPLSTARRVLREIEPYDVRNYEDPVGCSRREMGPAAPALIHSLFHPRSGHSSSSRLGGARLYFVVNFAVLGGINRAVRFIGACEAVGVGFWCYSGDAGICTAAYLHMTAAMPWIHEPSQSLFRWQIADVIRGASFRQTQNNVILYPKVRGWVSNWIGKPWTAGTGTTWKTVPWTILCGWKNQGITFRRLPLN